MKILAIVLAGGKGTRLHPLTAEHAKPALPFAQGYKAAKDASVTTLDRIYQAFYDAFAGTPQRTIGQQPGGGLPVSLNEVGVQTLTDSSLAAHEPLRRDLARWLGKARRAGLDDESIEALFANTFRATAEQDIA